MDSDDPLSRRAVLALGASGMAALAGCGRQAEIDDDPNPYNYEFVEGSELAENLPAYEDEDVKTQTYVVFDRHMEAYGPGNVRLYQAHPPDTVHTFPLVEEQDGPINTALGDEFHDPSYTDVLLEVYGSVNKLEDEAPEVYNQYTFMTGDAQRVDTGGTDE